ncbi:MAG: hypothetical protein M2R45_03164 [Verrucomicrobia subdivision 3 bacterium]|nr:hypothetical protein [Limisphaerales bacterium]MCS1413231.1 hypothetical protein [Limisphaerales bacterium]
MIQASIDSDMPIASLIMPQNGEMFGRHLVGEETFDLLNSINIVGDDLVYWHVPLVPPFPNSQHPLDNSLALKPTLS